VSVLFGNASAAEIIAEIFREDREIQAATEIGLPRRALRRVKTLSKVLTIAVLVMSPGMILGALLGRDDLICYFGYPWMGFAIVGYLLDRYQNLDRGYTHSDQTFYMGIGAALMASATVWIPIGLGLVSVVQLVVGGVFAAAVWACREYDAAVAAVRPVEKIVEKVVEVEVRPPLPEAENPSRWAHLPGVDYPSGYLYAIEFPTGVVKIGKTNDPVRRLGEHRRDAEKFGVVMQAVWISVAHDGYDRNESTVIAAACRKWKRSRQEYFHDADWIELTNIAEKLAGGTAFET
jgi:predicted GIY-YIG superfamily endonuclease